MATVDHSLVAKELKRIIAASNSLKSQLRKALTQMEKNPSSFPPLDDVPPIIARRHEVCLRKVKLITHKQEFRLIFAHWTFDDADREEHCDILLAFPRNDDYQIDWEWVDGVIDN
jgi:hypothetical protein